MGSVCRLNDATDCWGRFFDRSILDGDQNATDDRNTLTPQTYGFLVRPAGCYGRMDVAVCASKLRLVINRLRTRVDVSGHRGPLRGGREANPTTVRMSAALPFTQESDQPPQHGQVNGSGSGRFGAGSLRWSNRALQNQWYSQETAEEGQKEDRRAPLWRWIAHSFSKSPDSD
jgi:hypothetical protein